MNLYFPPRWRALLALLGLALGASMAQAQVPADRNSYSRSSGFSYYGTADGFKNGLLKSETIEDPSKPESCVVTTYDYDTYGNRISSTTASCGATGQAAFTTRTTTQVYADGRFPTSSTNALGHTETTTFDGRFGAPVKLMGPNGLPTVWEVDAFGRKVFELRVDGTGTRTAYCYLQDAGVDTASNSPECAALPVSRAVNPLEVPAGAVMFVHTEPRLGTGTTRIGPFSRVYTDRLGRVIRTVTEGFDGTGQPAALRGALVARDVVYNAFGAKTIETQPYFLATLTATTVGTARDYGVSYTEYDDFGRPVRILAADPAGTQTQSYGDHGTRVSSLQRVEYDGLTTRYINDKGQMRTEERDIDGKVVRVTDPSGAQVAHRYDAFGNLVATRDALQNQIAITYDIRGRKVQIVDPDAGTTVYGYDALGQLRRQQNAKGQVTTFDYDTLGRMTQRVDPEYTSTWTYDSCAVGKGKLCTSTTSHGISRRYVYDAWGRPVNTRTDITNGPSFASAVTYDGNGRVATQVYPSGLSVRYGYTTVGGFAETVSLVQGASIAPLPGSPSAGVQLGAGTELWRAHARSAAGALEKQSIWGGSGGPRIEQNALFQPATGRIANLYAGPNGTSSVQSQGYAWDSLGNLQSRRDDIGDGNTGAVTEQFIYGDPLNRLTGYTVSAPAIPGLSRSVTLQYNALGMLLYKSDVGAYRYGAQGAGSVRPHALLAVTANTATTYQYDANGNLIAASDGDYRSIAYTSFNLPDSQTGLSGPAGLPRYTWQYDENRQRIRETRITTSGTRTTWSLHPDNQGGLGFEREEGPGGVSNRHYVSVAGQVVGVLVSTTSLPNLGTATAPTELASAALVKMEFWHKDHLGSIVATTDHAGQVTARYAYDPFGKRRYTNGRYDDFGNVVVDWANSAGGTDRGYTGHEHLDDVGIVHMNGRLFDPRLGVMLQADPFIQDPTQLQNYNRYGYCLNNPLGCTDPSGYLSFFGRKILPGLFNNRNLRVAVAVAVAYVTYGYGSELATSWLASTSTAATSGFSAASISAVASFGGGAAAGFAGTLVMTDGDIGAAARAGLQGGLTGAAFGAIGSTFAAGTLESYIAHGVAGCVSSVAQGDRCGSGGVAQVLSKAFTVEFGSGFVQSVVVGGTVSAIGGGKFANGAYTAGFGYLFNHLGPCLANPMACARAAQAAGSYLIARWGPTATQLVWEFGAAEGVVASGGLSLALRTQIADEVASGLTNAHHAWPKYLGGEAAQDLVSLPQTLHRAYHTGLDQLAARWEGAAGFKALSVAEQTQRLTNFQTYTQWFDKTFGTNLMDAARRAGFACPGKIPGHGC